jgi:hypothetical protein
MIRFLTLCWIVLGVALAPLSSSAHVAVHAGDGASYSTHQHDIGAAASHAVHKDNQHSQIPCDNKSQNVFGDCCTMGCQLILAGTEHHIFGLSEKNLDRVTFKSEQRIGISPVGFDRPPRA